PSLPPPYPPPTICKHVDQQTAIPTPNLCEWDANVAYDKCIAYAKAHRHPELTDQTIWDVFEAERPKLVPYAGR
ncbi:hypothetical protein QJT78_52875, partial [Bradyrhizobium sp. Mp27]|nr:hypothetical protein [Bradyrhizobium sp. Mp27]